MGKRAAGAFPMARACLGLLLGLGILIALLTFEWKQLSWLNAPSQAHIGRSSIEFGTLGVPWCSSKEGAAVGWSREELLAGLREFIPIYRKRPIKNNAFGMGLDHSFGLWFLARKLKPQLMVESGAFKGHSTWVMRQAMPDVPIVSLSPRHPEKYLKKGPAYVDRNCYYFAGKSFIDFGNMDWDKLLAQHGILDKSRVLVFFDDHQNQLKRMKQAYRAGFSHLIFEDNYDTGTGDHYSLRQICDQVGIEGGGHTCSEDSEEANSRRGRKDSWEKAVEISELCGSEGAWWGVRGEMRDNFNHSNVAITHHQHAENARIVLSMLEVYWELPPVAGPTLTHQKRYDPARSTPPLIDDADKASFLELDLKKFEKRLFNGYTQMAYARLAQNHRYAVTPELS